MGTVLVYNTPAPEGMKITRSIAARKMGLGEICQFNDNVSPVSVQGTSVAPKDRSSDRTDNCDAQGEVKCL